MKLGIGSAQFGMNYGAFNRSGQPSFDEVHSILKIAAESGAQLIDTAPAYGNSEEILGHCIPQSNPFQIVTKTPHFKTDRITREDVALLQRSFHESLRKLRQEELYGLLLHHADDLLTANGEFLFEAMFKLKAAGRVGKIGVSVYNAKQIDAIFSRYPLDLIQVPLNVFDQRLLHSGHLKKLKEQGLEIHVRSPFLQGVLLAFPEELPEYFRPITSHLQNYRRWMSANRLSPAQAALGFLNQLPEIDAVIVGVETEEQFRRNLQEVRKPWPVCDMPQFAIEDESIIDPRLWQFNISRREEAP